MTLSFDPKESYVEMIMKLSDDKVTRFFKEMGIDIDLDKPVTPAERDLMADVFFEDEEEYLHEEG